MQISELYTVRTMLRRENVDYIFRFFASNRPAVNVRYRALMQFSYSGAFGWYCVRQTQVGVIKVA